MSNFLKKISNLLLTGEIFDDRIQHALTKQRKMLKNIIWRDIEVVITRRS